jgi:fatty-acyl-CoA synthase
MSAAIPYFDWIAHHANVRPNKVAVVDRHGDDSSINYTYAQLHDRVERLAAYLRSVGVERGDRVGLLATNGIEFFDVEFACGRLGAIAVLLNWRLTVPELTYICTDSSPRVLIHGASMTETANALQGPCGISQLLSIDLAAGENNRYEVALGNADTKGFVAADCTLDDPCTIMYTSGTTGHPKGAVITQGMNFWNCVNLGFPARITPNTVQLVVLPLFHTGGLNCYANPVLHAGGTVIVIPTFDPATALKLLGDPSLAITHFFAVPAPYQFMMQHPDFAATDLSRLEVAGVGGAPCALTILETWAARGVDIIQGYGMTETSPGSVCLDAADAQRKIGSAGKPLLHTRVRIVDENSVDVAPGAVGELWTKGPNITPGYWNRPDANEASFDDGWLKTGDAARIDDEGFIYIVDRWKDMYISGGENVYPAEVENVIHRLPQVADCAVIGVPSEKWGEIGFAVVVLKPGTILTREELVTHCAANLARFKVPSDLATVEVLPRNAGGKVLKRELRTQFLGTDAPAIS